MMTVALHVAVEQAPHAGVVAETGPEEEPDTDVREGVPYRPSSAPLPATGQSRLEGET